MSSIGLLTATAAAALVVVLWVAALALLTPRGPQTCVRLYADSGRLIQQWTTDHGANTPLTGWTFEVDGQPVRAWGHLTEVPGPCTEEHHEQQ